jgi:PAS domain S-box-containing protein
LDFRGLTSIYVDIPALRPGTVGGYAFAVLCTLVALMLRFAIDPHVVGAQYIVFVPAVTASTLVSGVRAGFVSAALSFAVAIFFFLPPRLTFYVENPAEFPALALFAMVMVSEVIVASGMRLALERYHELSWHLEQRVEARTAEALLRSRQLDAANQRLRQSNDELLAVYDQGLYAAHLDMDGKVFRASRACVEGCGFIPGEIIGKPFWECGWFNKPETQAWVRNGFELAARGVLFRGEVDYVFKNGTEHTSEIAFIPIRDDDRVAFVFVPGLDVTERVRQYRATFENAAVGIAHLTPDLKWQRVNKTVTRITGYSAAELATKTMPEVTHPDDVDVTLARIEQVREGKAASYDIEKRYVRKDGTTTWVRAAASGVRTSDGSIDHFVLVVQDITDNKQAQEKIQLLMRETNHRAMLLEESRDRLQFALDSALLGWWQYDPIRGVVWGDTRLKEMFEIAEDWPNIEEFKRRVHPDDQERVWAAMEAATDPTNPKPYAIEFRHKRGDGEVRWIEANGRVRFEGSGRERRAVSMVGTGQDITARKQREEAQARLAAIVTSSADGVVGKTLDGIVTSWNEAAERMFGYSAGEMLGQSIRRLIPAERQAEEDMILAHLAQNKSIVRFDTKRVTKDGRTFDASVTISPVHDGEGRVISAAKVIRDITERKQIEEQVRLLMHEANHRAKNMLSLVQAVARQTAAHEPEDFVGRFTERLQALSANQDLLVRNEWHGVDVEDLARAQLAHFADLVGSRITPHGPKLRLNAAAAQAIGLAMHELATNAGKYGALSTDKGRVDVGWGTDGDTFTMSWTECEGPLVSAPRRGGFGTTVVDAMAKRTLGGEVELDYAPSGLGWRLTCPAANALEPREREQNSRVKSN